MAGKPSLSTSPKATNSSQKQITPAENAATNPLTNNKSDAAADTAAATNSDKPKSTHSDQSSGEVASTQETAGAEEMTKAKNASDAAAQAAWLWKATAKGNPDAPVQLADMYVKGSGVPRSCEQAMVLLKTAAEKANVLARNRLAAMYSTGSCVQRNRVEAYHWLSSALAANPNSQWAQQNRDLIWQQMTPGERAAAAKYR
jgi:TPR repeat protein